MYHTVIGHAHLKVRNLVRALDFYTRFFNLQVVEQIGSHFVFLSGGGLHHEIALQQLGPNAPAPNPAAVGLYHVAFEVPDQRSFALAYRELTQAGVEVGLVDHLISWAMYFSDPDGNGLEIYWDTRAEPHGRQIWRGENAALPAAQVLAVLSDQAVADSALDT